MTLIGTCVRLFLPVGHAWRRFRDLLVHGEPQKARKQGSKEHLSWGQRLGTTVKPLWARGWNATFLRQENGRIWREESRDLLVWRGEFV